MMENDLIDRLSRIQTMWSKLLATSAGAAAEQQRHELLVRYYGAAFRYLLGILRDPAVAEELAQDFAVRMLRGDFRRADPQRGRFRDFLKTAVRHLVIDYWRQQGNPRSFYWNPQDRATALGWPPQTMPFW